MPGAKSLILVAEDFQSDLGSADICWERVILLYRIRALEGIGKSEKGGGSEKYYTGDEEGNSQWENEWSDACDLHAYSNALQSLEKSPLQDEGRVNDEGEYRYDTADVVDLSGLENVLLASRWL